MSLLSQSVKPVMQPPIIMIAGESGLGKTLLGSQFPKPYLCRIEDGSDTLFNHGVDIPMSPNLNTSALVFQMMDEIIALGNQEKIGTVVIDTVSALDKIFHLDVINSDPNPDRRTLKACHGGFQAGDAMIREYHIEFVKRCVTLKRSGFAVVLLCHYQSRKVEEVSSDPYVKGSLQLPKQVTDIYKNECDAIGFLSAEKLVMGADTKSKIKVAGKVAGTGNVIISFNDKVAFDCKTRGIKFPDKITVPEGENPLLEYIPFFNQ